ncbi:MAG: hypothetical protein U5R48_09290 [Gammaproteobacteria bacterium]|nr:hypothetical protein [Gammaproteobacteria bacterium]
MTIREGCEPPPASVAGRDARHRLRRRRRAADDLAARHNDLAKAIEKRSRSSRTSWICSCRAEANRSCSRTCSAIRPRADHRSHLDLQRVRADQELHVHLPIHVLGEEECLGVRQSNGQILHQMIEVEVVCLPANLPEYLEIDVTDLDVGDSIHLSEVPVPEGVTIPALELGEDHDQPVVQVVEKRVQAEEEDEDADEAAESGEDESAEDEGKGSGED